MGHPPAKQLFLGSIRWSPALFIAAWAIAVIIKEGWSPPYALLLGLQVAVIFAVVIWLTRWSWSFVALGPDGVHIFNHARKRGGTFAWSRVGYARYSVFFEIVTLAIDHKSMRLSVRRYFGGKLSEAERCTRAINRYPRPPYRLAVKPSTDASSASEQMV
jgi:hypothetical protein